MKRHKSVLQLFIRSSFLQVLAVCLVMSIAECILFFRTWEKLNVQYQARELRVLMLENVIEEAKLFYVFMVGIAVITMLLNRIGRNMGGRQEYTLYRLQIAPKQVFLWQALYNSYCYILFWAVQAVVAFLLCLYFVRTADSSMVTNQSLFLAFYRSDYLHAVLPLEHMARWICNLSWFIALGWSVAYDVYVNRRGKHTIWMYAVLIGGYACFMQGLEDSTPLWTFIFLYIVSLVVMGFFTLKEGKWTVDGE